MATKPVSVHRVRRYVATVAAALLSAVVLTACVTIPNVPGCADCVDPYPPDPNP
jgi:hypothetical protein